MTDQLLRPSLNGSCLYMTILETKPPKKQTLWDTQTASVQTCDLCGFLSMDSLAFPVTDLKSAQIISKLSSEASDNWKSKKIPPPPKSITEQVSGGSLIRRHTRRFPSLEARTKEGRAVRWEKRMQKDIQLHHCPTWKQRHPQGPVVSPMERVPCW